jgi:hypothetical protein
MGYTTTVETVFEQSTPASIWNITHGVGYPIIDVYVEINGKLEKMMPQKVEHISSSQSKIYFSAPTAGIAKLVG